MTFDQATENLPVNTREYLRTSMTGHGIPLDDPQRAAVLAQAELTVFLDRRRNVLLGVMGALCIMGMGLAGFAGYWYGKSQMPRPMALAAMTTLPHATTMDGKDVLIVDTRTWNLEAWIHSDKAIFFPARTSTGK